MLGLVTDGVLQRIGKVQPPLIGLNQYDRTRLTHLKRSDDKSSLSIQFFQIVYQTDRSFRLRQQTGNFLSGNTVNSKRLLPLNKCRSAETIYLLHMKEIPCVQ